MIIKSDWCRVNIDLKGELRLLLKNPITISLIAAAYSGNKGAAAMLESVINNLSIETKRINYQLLSVYPQADFKQNTHQNVKVFSCKPEEIIFVAFPLACLFYLFKFIKPIRVLILKNPILNALGQSDIVVDLAGVSFVDSRGFIMNTYNFICMATPLLLGRKVFKYSQALGPFKSFWNRFLARVALPKLEMICARGEITKTHLEDLGLKNITVCADGAFMMSDQAEAKQNVQYIIASDKFYASSIIGVSVSSVVEGQCEMVGIKYKEVTADFINYLIETKGYGVLIIANAAREGKVSKRNNDLPLCQEVYKLVNNKDRCRYYHQEFSAYEIREFINLCKLIVASRFHVMIGALYCEVPVFLIGWSHKYQEVLDMFDLGGYAINYKDLSLERLTKGFAKLEDNEPQFMMQIEKHLPAVIESSKNNIHAIQQVVSKGEV